VQLQPSDPKVSEPTTGTGRAVSILGGAQDPTGQSPEVVTSTSAPAVITLGVGFMPVNEIISPLSSDFAYS